MKKSLKYLFLIVSMYGIVTASEPSKFIDAARFYSKDFEYKSGMKIVTMNTQIGIIDDEVYIGRPRVYINDSIVLCKCGKEAVNISFKKGVLTASCANHEKKIQPVNQLKYPSNDKKTTKEKEVCNEVKI